MKSFVLTCSIFLLAISAHGQPPIDLVTGKITGVVQDSTNNQGVEFANVALLDQATRKPVNGDVCDDKGKFTIAKLPPGNYIVAISFIGYTTKMIKVQLTDKKNDVNLGNIILSPSVQMLKAVEIVGQRPLIEEKVDRTVYNAENDATAKGGDATDVLRRVPLLDEEIAKGSIEPISLTHFLVNLSSLCNYPVVAKPMLQTVHGMTDGAYKNFLQERKKVIFSTLFKISLPAAIA